MNNNAARSAHFLSPMSLSLDETRDLLALAAELKRNPFRKDLAGKTLGLLFFNPSLRTRVSFDVAMYQLGGHATTLEVGAGVWKLEHRDGVVMDGDKAEHIAEAAQVLARYVDALGVRAFPEGKSWAEDKADPIMGGFAKWSDKPIVNMESSLYHPCQSLADLLTIQERLGDPKGQPIAITWAWHPKALPMAVPHSIFLEAAKFGMNVRLAHPKGWELDADVMAQARGMANAAGGSVRVFHDMEEAMAGSRVVYAKSWGSLANYGDPAAEEKAKAGLRDAWRVTTPRMEKTDRAFFMHCLPVRRNVIVDDAVLDSPMNAAIDEAENRLHVQKALLLRMLGNG
jgi:N-acetylornithine carbamoyltransferase